MNQHEQITTDIHLLIEEHSHAEIISPAWVAARLCSKYAPDGLPAVIEYGAVEHYKQLARGVLRGRFDVESDASDAVQGELFSGHLQERYPTPHKRGQDPVYKRLELLTKDEVRWNIHQLRRSANARMMHADALEAWDQSRGLAAE